MKNHIFLTHLRRMVTNPALYFGIGVQALGVVLLSCARGTYSVDEAIMHMHTPIKGLPILFFLALPSVAYSMIATDDQNTRMIHFWSIRSGTKSYAIAYYMTTLCSGFFMTFCGLGLGCLAGALLGFRTDACGAMSDMDFLAEEYSLLLYYVVRIGDLAMGSMTVAGIASAAAVCFRNKVTVLTIPVVVFMMLNNFFSADHMLFSMSKLILGSTYAPEQLGLHLLLHLWMSMIWWVVCGWITVRHVVRSVQA